MADLPRLTVTQEQAEGLVIAEQIAADMGEDGPSESYLRLPEWPTWTCATCQGVGSSHTDHVGNCPDCDGHGSMPIFEGTRVEVGWWDVPDDRTEAIDWYPVATATLTEVKPGGADIDHFETWIVTLTDVRSTDE